MTIPFLKSEHAAPASRRVACVALALLALTVPCHAAPPRAYSLAVAPNAACPDDGPIVERIARRVPAAQRVASGGEVAGAVNVVREGTRIRAIVTVTRADGSAERAVSGSSCEDVADAVAFILALALDADTPSTTEVTGAAGGAVTTAGEQAPTTAGAAALPTAPVSVAPVAPPPSAERTSRPAPAAHFRAGGGVLVGVSGGVAPALALSEGLFFEAARRSATSLTQSFRLVGLHAGQAATTSAGNAELDLFALRLQACPLGRGRALFVEGCASFDYGRLRGRGYAVPVAKSESATWYGPGALGRAGAAFGGWFELGVEAGFVAPLARDRFYFLPNVTVHTIPPVAGYGFVFAGLRT